MNKWLVLILTLLLCPTSFAQKIKVKRIKGNQAVVEFSGSALQQGQVYELAQDEFTESFASSQRRYSVGASFALTNTKSDAAGSSNESSINLAGKFGWNFVNFEIGPLFSYSSSDVAGKSASVLKAGGFADYNMIDNIYGELFIYGVGAEASMGQSDIAGSKHDIMTLFVGPFAKWFPDGGNFGVRFDAGYLYQFQTATTGDIAVSGIGANIGIMNYF